MKQISLNGTWLMYRKDIGKQIQAQVPGSVFHDLMENGLMEDPFYRDNEKKQENFPFMTMFMKENSILRKTS